MANKEPSNLEAEMSLLGCAILSDFALAKVTDEITSDMFYDERNSIIFEAIKKLHNSKSKIDFTILKNEIEKTTPINAVGGAEYLTEVIDSVYSASNVDSYINIIREKSIRRNLIQKCEDIEKKARDEKSSTEDLIDGAEKDIFEITKQRKVGEFQTSVEVVEATRKKVQEAANIDKDITGIPTGFIDFDKLTSGLHPNQLVIVAARPGMGKSAMALNIVCNAGIHAKKTVAIFSLEMASEELMSRMIASVGSINGTKLKTGKLNNDDWKKFNEAASLLENTNIFFDSTSAITVGEIRSKCRRLATRPEGLDLVVIDYLQIIQGSKAYQGNRVQEVSDISRSLKSMAMELHVPVVALAQLARSTENRTSKKPVLSDLRESGQIEQDADVIAFIYRDDYYEEKELDRNTTVVSELLVEKQRSGSTGKVKLVFDMSSSCFRNYISEPTEDR